MTIKNFFKAGWNTAKMTGFDAEEKNWIVEKINQSKEGLSKYQKHSKTSVKRSDFICRNAITRRLRASARPYTNIKTIAITS